MKTFFAMFRTTLRQLLGGKGGLIVSLLLAALPTLVTFIQTREGPPSRAFSHFHDAAIPILFIFVLPVVSLVFGASALGDERRDQTLSFLLLRPQPRAAIAGAKLLAAWVLSFLVVGGAAAAAAAVVGIYGGDWSIVGPIILAMALSTLAYTSVFLLLGYVTKWAVVAGLAYAFIWESGISFAVSGLSTISLFRIGFSSYAAQVDVPRSLDEILGTLQPGTGGAAAKAIVIGGIAVVVAAGLLRRRDIT
jgi:ABC-2 type transport system permease protein